MCVLVAVGLTQPVAADHVWRHGPQLPLGLDLLQDSLMKAAGAWGVGLQLACSHLIGHEQCEWQASGNQVHQTAAYIAEKQAMQLQSKEESQTKIESFLSPLCNVQPD